MDDKILIQGLRRLERQDKFQCFGCGYEHGRSIRGCAIIREAVERLEQLTAPEPNDPLTLDELREMDGEPVWIVEHPDWGHWELSEDAEDYLSDRETAFYGMMHEDPCGKSGLHAMGWIAYRRKPEAHL